MTSAAAAATAAPVGRFGGGADGDGDVFSPSMDDHQQRGRQPKEGGTETHVVAGDRGGGEGGRLEATTPSQAAAAAEVCPLDPSSASAPSHPPPPPEDYGGGGASAASDDDYATPPEGDGSCSDDDTGDGRGDVASAVDAAGGGGGGELGQRRQGAIDAIHAVHLEMDQLEARAKLDGTSSALVHELVTQMCCRLDGIETFGFDEVRSMRKAAIARAEGIDGVSGACSAGGSSKRDGNAPVPTEPGRRGLEGINPFDEFRDVLPEPPAGHPADPPSGVSASAPPAERKPIMNSAPAAGGVGMDSFVNVTTAAGGIMTDGCGDGDDGRDQNEHNHMMIGPVEDSMVPLDPHTASGAVCSETTMDQLPGPTSTSKTQEDLLGWAMAQRPERELEQQTPQGQKAGSRGTSDASLPINASAGDGVGAGSGGNMDVFAGLFVAAAGGGGGDCGDPSSAPPPPPPPAADTDTDTDTTPTPTPSTARSSAGNISVDDVVLAAPSALVPSTPPVIAHGKVMVPAGGGAGGEVMDLGIGFFDGDKDDDHPSPSPTPAAAAAVSATETEVAPEAAAGEAIAAATRPSYTSASSSRQMQNLQHQLDAWEATRSSAAVAAQVSPTGSTERKAAAAAGDDDPFGIFGGGGTSGGSGGGAAAAANNNDEPWGGGAGRSSTEGASPGHAHVGVGSGSGALPPGGTVYETKIYAARVGIMFLTARHLADSLFLGVPEDDKRRLLSALGERPVVAFMVERSGGLEAGVKLGHVLLSVDGRDVANPVDAQRRIAEGPRPLPMSFYIPGVPVVSAEGMHMVKYDVNTTYAPSTSGEWKLKYVVVGGVIAKKWQINMYRSKAEYDEAVSAVLAGRPIPVKIKQFSLVGGSRMLDDGDVKTVRYNDRPKAWKYVVVERPEIPGSFPIKIAHGSVEGLRPVMRGVQYAMAGRNKKKILTVKPGRHGTGNPSFFQPLLGRKGKKKSSKAKT